MSVDFFHSPYQGDWRFDARDWKPARLVETLASCGIRTMVSHWPTVSPRSENHELFHNRGWLVGTEHGQGQHFHYTDRDEPGSPKVGMRYYDANNAEARDYVAAL